MDMNEPKPAIDIDDFIKEFDSNNFTQDLTGEPKKLSEASHEIVFNITANILEENEKGEKVKSKQICTKYYHIPVPMGGDANAFMVSFFDFLEKSLAGSAKHAYNTNNPLKNTEMTNE